MKDNRFYLVATIITISVLVINQLFIQFWLYQKKEDARLINLSGRQRMLSQKLLAQVYGHRDDPEGVPHESILQTHVLWKQSHEQLIKELDSDKFGFLQDSIIQELNELTPYITSARSRINPPLQLSLQDFSLFREDQQDFLIKMDKIVLALEQDSDQKLQFVIIMEIVFALMSLGLIYFEITYIFKKINDQLKEQNVELTESNQLLEQYAYLAAHDLKVPAQNVINFTEVLHERIKPQLSETDQEYLSYILTSAIRMKDTTDDLLQFASVNSHQLELLPFSPQTMIDHLLKDFGQLIVEKHAEILVHPLPETIHGDPHLIQIVFQNLISNSLKFVSAEKKPQIQIRYQALHGYHIFEIQDNGIGIAPEQQGKIFEMFKRLHPAISFPGTGIGLSICQKIVSKHGGQVDLVSAVDQGSTFMVRLPVISS